MRGAAALRAALIALLATTLVPRVARSQEVQCDPGDVEVRSLEFSGNRAVGDDELAVRVITTASAATRRFGFGTRRCLDRSELPRDVLRLREYYQRRGFHRAAIDTVVAPAGAGRVRVTFAIEEGPPTLLRQYSVNGLGGVPDSSAILSATRVRAGRPFDIDQLAADKDTIIRRLRNAGYYRAQVFHQYNTRTDSLYADASLTVIPGNRARFGEPRIAVDPVEGRGQQIPDNVVRRLIGIAPGSLYSDRVIVDAQRSLFALGTYRHIEVAPLPDSLQPPGDSIVVLSVVLAEDFMRQLDSEFGWATLDCGRVRMQYTDRNWMASARRFELTGQASKIGYGDPLANTTTRDFCDFNGRSPLAADEKFSGVLHYHLGASVRQPRLLGFRWTPALALYTERRGEYTAYLRTTYLGADLSATRELGFRTPIRLGYTVEYGRTTAEDAALCALFNRCDPNEETPLDTLATLGIVNASLTRVRTDNPISPTRGYVWRGEVRSSASRLLGTSRSLFFNKGTGDVSLYRTVAGNVLAMRLRAGAVVGVRTAGDTLGFVPPQERLYAGGASSVRGFQQNELGQVVYVTARVPRDTQRVIQLIDTVFVRLSGADSVFRLQSNANTGIERTVPLGGNSLVVLNLDYRVRDPFFLPDRLQYTFFLDAGAIGTQTSTDLNLGLERMKWTPGLGLRMLTPVGPVQVNVGYNPYDREPGPLYFNPDVSTLICVSPNNAWEFVRRPTVENPDALLAQSTPPCRDIDARPRKGLQRLTFTFSIGSDF
jgi:outer membrane protein assembly factor BamA